MEQPFTTGGPFARWPIQDRRGAWGDPADCDAWLESSGIVFWTARGVVPHLIQFTPCAQCHGTGHIVVDSAGLRSAHISCRDCRGTGWTTAAVAHAE